MSKDEIQALRSIASWLKERTGLYYPDRKLDTLKHKLFKVCLDQRMTIEEIAAALSSRNGASVSQLALKVAAAASTNHTAFFREDVWGFFREVLAQTLKENSRVRIWSAAASSGEEAYTIAITAAELLGLESLQARVAVLGTDISFQVLKQAEDGVYPAERLEGMDPSLKRRYFSELSDSVVKGALRVREPLRRICLFRRMNLKKRPYPFKHRFHIVFCRNVLYYFTPTEREKIVNEIHRVTEDGGYLFVSVTECLTGMTTPWRRVPGRTGVYRKTGRGANS